MPASLSRDFRWVLADDAAIVPFTKLSDELRLRLARRRGASAAGQFIVHRPRSRASPKAVDASVRDVLLRFRRPAPFLQVVIDSAEDERTDPFALMKKLEPLVRRFVSDGVLVRADRGRDESLRAIEPTLRAGSKYEDLRIITCVSTTIDSEVYLVQGGDGISRGLKLSRPHFSTEKARSRSRRQLEREFKVLGRLRGTAACRIFGRGVRAGRTYGVVEWIEGVDVASRAEILRKAAAGHAAARRDLAALACACLNALDSVHRRGVLHGDIHPRNFIVTPDGAVRLVDFGLARAFGPGQGVASSFSGVAQYMPPEAAVSARAGRHSFLKTARSEVYSAAVLVYRLLTGVHCLPDSVSRSEGLLRIERSPMRTFAAAGASAWPEVEAVLRRATSKRPSKRFSSMAEFSRALARAASRTGSAARLPRAASSSSTARAMVAVTGFAEEYLDELRSLSFEALRSTQDPPHASVASGGAGVAHALLRAARQRGDPDLLSLAANWIGLSVRSLGHPDALYAPDQDMTLRRVGHCSLYFSEMGVHLVHALIARALDAEVMADRADRALARCFGSFSKSPARDTFLGQPGCLIAASVLLQETGSAEARRVGSNFVGAILNDAQVSPAHGRAPWAEHDNLGLAHGRAGIYFALTQWALASQSSLPAWIPDGLRELLRAGIQVGGGLDWPIRTGSQPEYMDSLCNGAPGIAMAFARAYELYGDRDFLAGARAAGARVMRDEADFANICCGAAGRAYGLLSLARIDPDGPWRSAAIAAAARALPRRRQGGSVHGLLKGQSGIFCLALDLARTDGVVPACPLLEGA